MIGIENVIGLQTFMKNLAVCTII